MAHILTVLRRAVHRAIELVVVLSAREREASDDVCVAVSDASVGPEFSCGARIEALLETEVVDEGPV